jgi:peptidoglycan/LPS O-acetylase OafA/YrhL
LLEAAPCNAGFQRSETVMTTCASLADPKPRGARVAGLDGLRGLLAVYVMIAHVANAYGNGRLIGGASVSVMIFFVISGYVLTRSWNGNFLPFLVRRFFRLWPVYALSLAVGGYMIHQGPPLSLYFWYPFDIHGNIPYNPVMWSLFVEAWSALFMPIIVWIGRRPGATALTITALAAMQFVSKDISYGAYIVLGSYMSKFTFDERYFKGPFTQWLGKISYSLYLTHLLVIAACRYHFPDIAIYIAMPASLAAAYLVWLIVERPSLWLSRYFGGLSDRYLVEIARRFRSRLRAAPVFPV